MHGIAANVPIRGRARHAWPGRRSHDALARRVAELTSALRRIESLLEVD